MLWGIFAIPLLLVGGALVHAMVRSVAEEVSRGEVAARSPSKPPFPIRMKGLTIGEAEHRDEHGVVQHAHVYEQKGAVIHSMWKVIAWYDSHYDREAFSVQFDPSIEGRSRFAVYRAAGKSRATRMCAVASQPNHVRFCFDGQGDGGTFLIEVVVDHVVTTFNHVSRRPTQPLVIEMPSTAPRSLPAPPAPQAKAAKSAHPYWGELAAIQKESEGLDAASSLSDEGHAWLRLVREAAAKYVPPTEDRGLSHQAPPVHMSEGVPLTTAGPAFLPAPIKSPIEGFDEFLGELSTIDRERKRIQNTDAPEEVKSSMMEFLAQVEMNAKAKHLSKLRSDNYLAIGK